MLFRRMKNYEDDPVSRSHTNVLKHLLTNKHQFLGVCYAAMHLLNGDDHKCDNFYQHAHIDEKWFYLVYLSRKCEFTLHQMKKLNGG